VLSEAPGSGLGADAGTTDPAPTAQYCGTDDYPPCPSGTVCVLNGANSEDANMAGVGICQPE
jgi:hypothetical protein